MPFTLPVFVRESGGRTLIVASDRAAHGHLAEVNPYLQKMTPADVAAIFALRMNWHDALVSALALMVREGGRNPRALSLQHQRALIDAAELLHRVTGAVESQQGGK